jgi:hypothetical protein
MTKDTSVERLFTHLKSLDNALGQTKALGQIDAAMRLGQIAAGLGKVAGLHESLDHAAKFTAAFADASKIQRALDQAGRLTQMGKVCRAIEEATRPFAQHHAALKSMERHMLGPAGIAAQYSKVFAELQGLDRPEGKALRSITAATRRLALAGLAAGADQSFADWIRGSNFLTDQVATLTRIAGLARGFPEAASLADTLDEVVSTANDALAEDEHAHDRLLELVGTLREQLDSSVGSKADAVIRLFLTLVGLVLAFSSVNRLDDIDARQRRLLLGQEGLHHNMRMIAAELERIRRDSADADDHLESRISELAESVAVEPIRVVVVKARLHSRATGASNTLMTFKPGDTVVLLHARGRWALVEAESNGTVGWLPKKSLAIAPH